MSPVFCLTCKHFLPDRVFCDVYNCPTHPENANCLIHAPIPKLSWEILRMDDDDFDIPLFPTDEVDSPIGRTKPPIEWKLIVALAFTGVVLVGIWMLLKRMTGLALLLLLVGCCAAKLPPSLGYAPPYPPVVINIPDRVAADHELCRPEAP